MSDVKKLAQHIMEKYARGLDGLSSEDCHDLVYAGYEGTFLKNSQCDALQDVLGHGIEGIVTAPERERLEKGVKFSPKFVDTLAGEDGRAALRRRAAWLGEFYLTYNKKVKESDRQAALDEILDIGAAADGTIPALIRAAEHPDKAVRAQVAKILGKFGPKASAAIPALIKMLKDEDGGESRIEAARALGRIGEKLEAVPALASVFHSEDKALRIAAIEAVAEIGAAEAVYWLALISQEDDKEIFAAVKSAFSSINVQDKTIILTLMEIVQDPKVEHDKKIMALQALGRWREKANITVGILKDISQKTEDEELRMYAIDALALIGTKDSYRALKEIGTDQVVVSLVLELERPEANRRRIAAYLIGEIGSRKDVSELKVLLDDQSAAVREMAAISIGKLGKGDKGAIRMLERLLDDNDSKVLTAAVKALGDMGSSARIAFDNVARLLEDVDVEVRKAAVRALLKIDPDATVGAIKKLGDNEGDAVPILRGALKPKSPPAVKRAALKALKDMGEKGKGAVPDLIELMAKGKGKDKALAAEALGVMGDTDLKVYRALLAGSIDGSAAVRKASRRAIDELGFAKLITILGSADEEARIRRVAFEILRDMGPKAVLFLPMFIDLLSTGPDDSSRIAAARIIGGIGREARDAEGALLAARGSGSEKLKEEASRALELIGYEEPVVEEPLSCETEKSVKKLIELMRKGEDSQRITAIECLAEMGSEVAPAVPHLAKLVSSENAKLRAAAAQALVKIGDPARRSIPRVIRCLRSKDEGVRSAAVYVLWKLGGDSKEVVSAIARLMDDDSEKVKRYARLTLTKIGEKAVPALLSALEDPDPDVREAAAGVLGGMGPAAKSAEEGLCLAALDKEAKVRKASADALSKILAEEAKASLGDIEEGELKYRIYAARRLGDAKVQAAVAPSIHVLEDAEEDPRLRGEAAGALAMIGTGKAAKALTRSIGDRDLKVRMAVARAIIERGKGAKGFVPGLVRMLRKGDENARSGAVYVLARLGKHASPAIPELRRLLKSKDADLRSKAQYILGKISPQPKKASEGTKEEEVAQGPGPVISGYLMDMKSPELSKRIAAAKALLAMGEAAAPALPGLLEMLRGGDENARSSAVYVLSRMGEVASGAVGDLVGMAKGDDEALALKAMYILGKMGPAAKKAAPVLKKIANKGKSEELREGAKKALEGVEGK